jgi:ribosomal protein S18 acetylase RimI-like enzyme
MVELLVTYMEMTAPPAGPALPAPLPEATVARETLPRPDYLRLYRAVGEALQWDLRLGMADDALDQFLADPATDIHLLRLDGAPAGFCETDRAAWPEMEIVHFGLLPSAQGKRLGPYLLDRALRAAWQEGVRRIWLHTDTNDHAKAIATYERAGFRVYERRWETFSD